MNRRQLTEKHNFVSDTTFRLKSVVLTGNRFFKNLFSPHKKFSDHQRLKDTPVIAFSESDLWNPFDNKENWILTAGKIENLRIAARKLNGLEVKANEIFSFWRHIGNPNLGKGYVIGREIREGCIVPTVAGGLCQLSNALYDAALKANFEIVERHKHTKIIQGSLAEQDRDATVKWNYIDLRFKSDTDFRIEVVLTSDKLIVSFKSHQKSTKTADNKFNLRQSDKLNDCYSCGNFACYKHPDRSSVKQEIATTTFILDEKWKEFDAYIKTVVGVNDSFILPLRKNGFVRTERYTWSAIKSHKTSATFLQGIFRAIKLRFGPKQNNVFELALRLDKGIAQVAAKKIPVQSTHVVISQNLLPFIYETGILGGRTFDVLMTRLSIGKDHERLDFAYAIHRESPTLSDFRAPDHLIRLENQTLTKARKIITPHAEIAEMFKNKVERLVWDVPVIKQGHNNGNRILFPASALGRKGAYEIKKLAQELNLILSVTGSAIENAGFWQGVKTERFNGDFDEVGLVVYPTYIEHQPRQVLKAIAKHIPVVTTTACGLDASDTVKIVEVGNYQQLKDAVLKLMESMSSFSGTQAIQSEQNT